jgi:hypothetical protein
LGLAFLDDRGPRYSKNRFLGQDESEIEKPAKLRPEAAQTAPDRSQPPMGAYFTALDRQFPKKSEKIKINSERALGTLSQGEKVFPLSETTPLWFSRGHVTHSGQDPGFFLDSGVVFGLGFVVETTPGL